MNEGAVPDLLDDERQIFANLTWACWDWLDPLTTSPELRAALDAAIIIAPTRAVVADPQRTENDDEFPGSVRRRTSSID